MKKLLWLFPLLMFSALLSRAQDETLVNIYICAENNCHHSAASQELTYDDVEFLLGEAAPGASSSAVCVDDVCTWTDLSEADIELIAGGDGVIEPVDAVPGQFLPDTVDNELAQPADPAMVFDDPTLDSRDFWMLSCRADACRTTRSKITKSEAIIILGEEPPAGDYYIRCDEEGCRWQLWSGDLLPNDGSWQLDARSLSDFNCPEDDSNPLEQFTTQMTGLKTWTNPPQPADIIEGNIANFDAVTQSIPYTNGYLLRLEVGSGQFTSTVNYEWAVMTASLISGTIVLDLPSIYGGRCVVYVPFNLRWQE